MRKIALVGFLGFVFVTGCSGKATNPARNASRPTASGWRSVMKDWYDDGKFEQRHPCGAVREAMNHLAADPGPYNSASRDLRRYARRVC